MEQLFELALLVKAGQRDFERMTNAVMQPLGLTGAQADALFVIGAAGPLSLKELGGLLIAEAGHPSRLVDRLVEAGHVRRRPSADDRRSVELSLTAAGRRLETRVIAARAQLLAVGRGLVDEKELDAALKVLRRLAQHSAYAELLERRRLLSDHHASTASDQR